MGRYQELKEKTTSVPKTADGSALIEDSKKRRVCREQKTLKKEK